MNWLVAEEKLTGCRVETSWSQRRNWLVAEYKLSGCRAETGWLQSINCQVAEQNLVGCRTETVWLQSLETLWLKIRFIVPTTHMERALNPQNN